MKYKRFNQNSTLTRKMKAEYNKCVGCNLCMKNCPMLKTYCDSPKSLLNTLSDNTYFNGSIETIQMPFTCTLCSYCHHVCPKDVDLRTVFYELKTDIVKKVGFPPELGKTSLSYHQNLSFSNIFSTQFRKSKPKNKTVYIPGCSPAAYNPQTKELVYKYLNNHTDTVYYKKCCGNPTLSVGQISKFEKYTASVVTDIEQMDAKEIIVLCMNCYNTFSKLFPNTKVRTLWEFIEEYGLPSEFIPFNSRMLETSNHGLPDLTLHDPCPTRKHPHIHEAVRYVLSKMGVAVQEFDDNRDSTVCCGSGAMLSLVAPQLAETHKSKRASDAKTDHILTYCQECTEALNRSEKRTLHILDLLFGEMAPLNYSGDYNQQKISTLKKWSNRRTAKKSSENIMNLK